MSSLPRGILDNFHAPANAPLHWKCSLFSQQILKLQAHCGLYTYFLIPSYPKQGWLCSPSKSDISIFLFLVLYSLSCKSFLPSIPFWSSLKGDFALHEVLNKICFYHWSCFLESFSNSCWWWGWNLKLTTKGLWDEEMRR